MATLFQQYDAILTPTLGQVPLPLGSFQPKPEDPIELINRVTVFTPFAAIANLIGHPAMSVPLHRTSQGVPIGVHFIGDYAKENVLIRLAAQLEAARPWAAPIPPITSEVLTGVNPAPASTGGA